MATKKLQSAPNLYDELDAALREWLDDIACTPSRIRYDLSVYYPLDILAEIERDLRNRYAEIKQKQGDVYQRFIEDKYCKLIHDDIRVKRSEAILQNNYRRQHGSYTVKDVEEAKRLERLHAIPWLRACVYKAADIYARYGALDFIRPRLNAYLPGRRPRGAPRNCLRRRMFRQVFLAVYESFTGKEFDWYPISFRGDRPALVTPGKHSRFRVTITRNYLPAMINILRLLGERNVSQKTMEKVRDELRDELIMGPSRRSGLEPVREFYQNDADKTEKSFLINWVLSIGLYKHPKAATRFLETPIRQIVR